MMVIGEKDCQHLYHTYIPAGPWRLWWSWGVDRSRWPCLSMKGCFMTVMHVNRLNVGYDVLVSAVELLIEFLASSR